MTKIKNNESIHSIQKQAILILNNASVPNPSLDCDLIMTHVLVKPRVFLYSHPEALVSKTNAKKIFLLLQKRSQRIPLAYLTGIKNFFNRTFLVNRGVLIPRPETEHLVTQALACLNSLNLKKSISILDIGTGSGCIPLAIASEWNNSPLAITAVDTSQKAVLIARKNYQLFKKNLTPLHHMHIQKISPTQPYKKRYDLITANLPYLSDQEYICACKYYPEIKKEPRSAFVSDNDGYSDIFKVIRQLPTLLTKNGHTFFECSTRQEKKISHYIKDHLPEWKWSFIRDNSNKTSILVLTRAVIF